MEERLPTLDGLRAISILLVLACHLLPLGPKSLHLNETAGAMGMAIFFSLSGFLITQNLLRGQPVGDFFVRRAARILPLAYLYLLIVLIFFSPSAWTLAQNLLFTENYTYAWMEDAHFWSLCVEVHFYLAIGLSVFFLGRNGVFLLPIAFILITGLRIWHGATIDIQTHLRVDEICVGGCVAIAYHYGALNRLKLPSIALAAAAFTLALASWPISQWLQYFRPHFAGLLLCSAIVLQPSFAREILSSRLAGYVAKISYALYVIHPLTAYGWMNEGSAFERYALKRPISFGLAFLLAHISTFYYEARWISLSKRFLRTRRASVIKATAPTARWT